MVGDMMLHKMFGSPNVNVPADFGFLTTRDNIESHLLEQCNEVRSVRNQLKPSNVFFADSCPGKSQPSLVSGAD